MVFDEVKELFHGKIYAGMGLKKHLEYEKYGDAHILKLREVEVKSFEFTSQFEENGVSMILSVGHRGIPVYFGDVRQMSWEVISMTEENFSAEEEFRSIQLQVRPEPDGRLKVSVANDLHELPFFMSFTCDHFMEITAPEAKTFLDERDRYKDS